MYKFEYDEKAYTWKCKDWLVMHDELIRLRADHESLVATIESMQEQMKQLIYNSEA